jgi:hypothetical protein
VEEIVINPMVITEKAEETTEALITHFRFIIIIIIIIIVIIPGHKRRVE